MENQSQGRLRVVPRRWAQGLDVGARSDQLLDQDQRWRLSYVINSRLEREPLYEFLIELSTECTSLAGFVLKSITDFSLNCSASRPCRSFGGK